MIERTESLLLHHSIKLTDSDTLSFSFSFSFCLFFLFHGQRIKSKSQQRSAHIERERAIFVHVMTDSDLVEFSCLYCSSISHNVTDTNVKFGKKRAMMKKKKMMKEIERFNINTHTRKPNFKEQKCTTAMDTSDEFKDEQQRQRRSEKRRSMNSERNDQFKSIEQHQTISCTVIIEGEK